MKYKKKTCGTCIWQIKLNDGHYACEEGDKVVRVRKNDKFGKICDNWWRK